MGNELIVYDDERVEREVIAYFITNAKYFRAINPDLFAFALPRKVQTVLNAFYQEWGQAPTLESLAHYQAADVEVVMFLTEVQSMRLSDAGFRPAVQALFDMYLRRQIMDQAKSMVDNVVGRKVETLILQETLDRLSGLKHPLMFSEIERGEAADVARDVWVEYVKHQQNPELYRDGIRYGIYELDKITNGGTRRGHITLIYGDTSSGKTRLKSNMAYNMSRLGKRVLYITIEDSLRTLVSLWLSRASLMNFTDVQNATLSREHGEKFREVCEAAHRERNLPYVVYWTGIATSADIRREIDLYTARFQQPPDVVFFDYSNEAYPVRPFNNTSERYNYLFSEYRQLTSQYQVPLITSLQESRTGKQKKKEADYGLDSIGQSHYVAPHCHVVVYIKQSGTNGLDLYVQKNRYGERNRKILLYALWPVGYIGDRGRAVQHREVTEVLKINAPPPELNQQEIVQDIPVEVHINRPPTVNDLGSSPEDPAVDSTIGTDAVDELDYSTPES